MPAKLKSAPQAIASGRTKNNWRWSPLTQFAVYLKAKSGATILQRTCILSQKLE